MIKHKIRMGNIMSEYQNQTNTMKILSLHLRMLTELLHGHSANISWYSAKVQLARKFL